MSATQTQTQANPVPRRSQNRTDFIHELMERGVSSDLAERMFDRSRHWTDDMIDGCAKLLKTQKFRSAFRQSLCDQLKAWLEDDEPVYPYPLSERQAKYL